MSERKLNGFSINGRNIGLDQQPYIIAEMSANHNEDFDTVNAIIDAAANAGADALKVQTYTADTITLECDRPDFLICNEDSPWNGWRIYDLYKKASLNWDWLGEINDICREKRITFFSSVFDDTSVDFLERLNVPAYKIASFENNHFPLIEKVVSTDKPIIISTGASSESEIDELVSFLDDLKYRNYALLKCTSDYPARVEDSNLIAISAMREKYCCEIGLSDHTLGIGAALAGVALGASIIEKHFAVSDHMDGLDGSFSSDETEMSALVKECDRAWRSKGMSVFGLSQREQKNIQFKRSIYASADIEVGDTFSRENIKIVRPGFGMHPRYFSTLLGKISKKSYSFGEPLNEELSNE